MRYVVRHIRGEETIPSYTHICVCMYKGVGFIVLYPPECSHDLPPLAGLYTRTLFQSPRDNPERLVAYTLPY